MSRPNKILVISSRLDSTADYLSEKLVGQGTEIIRFNTETFPSQWELVWRSGGGRKILLSGNGLSFGTEEILSAWYRRPADPKFSEEFPTPSIEKFATDEAKSVLGNLWQVTSCRWVNHPNALRVATRKLHQLEIAETVGFQTPQTLLSNNADLVREFWHEQGGNVVVKSLHQDAIVADERYWFSYTSFLTQDLLEQLDRVKLLPTLFQAYIKPRYEIRVTVVGDDVFAAAIDMSGQPDLVDWRRLSPQRQAWQKWDLPESVAEKCRSVVKALNLYFAAIDLIITPEGEVFFLEINGNGQWVWIELITGLPISDAMVALLSRPD